MENVMKVKQFFLFVSSETPSSPPSTNNRLEAILVKLKEWLSAIPILFFSLLHELDDAFPPETWAQWLATAVRYLIAGAFLLSLILFLCCCCRRSSRISARTMKAPGTGGLHRLARSRFEANPRGYFRSLRAGTLTHCSR